MKVPSINTGFEAATRFLGRAQAAGEIAAATPAWSTKSLHSQIRFLRSDAHVAASALTRVDGGLQLGSRLRNVGDRLDEIARTLDDSSRSAGPWDISDAERMRFLGLLREPLESAERLALAARTALLEASAGANHVSVAPNLPVR